jgi:hypothetical protein
LLAELGRLGVVNAVITMDNAKYHKHLPEDTPKGSNKKSVLQDACRRWDIQFNLSDVKSTLWQLLPPKCHNVWANNHPPSPAWSYHRSFGSVA